MLCSFDDVCYVVSNPPTYPLARPVGLAADSTNSEVYEDFAVIANTDLSFWHFAQLAVTSSGTVSAQLN